MVELTVAAAGPYGMAASPHGAEDVLHQVFGTVRLALAGIGTVLCQILPVAVEELYAERFEGCVVQYVAFVVQLCPVFGYPRKKYTYIILTFCKKRDIIFEKNFQF